MTNAVCCSNAALYCNQIDTHPCFFVRRSEVLLACPVDCLKSYLRAPNVKSLDCLGTVNVLLIHLHLYGAKISSIYTPSSEVKLVISMTMRVSLPRRID